MLKNFYWFQNKKFSLSLLMLLLPAISYAHVKWFTGFTFLDKPLELTAVVNQVYLGLAALSVIVISALVFADKRADDLSWYRKINLWLSEKQKYSFIVMRIAMAAVFLISWAQGTLLTPELLSRFDWLIWLQFFLAVMLFFPRSSGIAGLGLIFIYIMAVFEFGIFHMLDYLHFVGVGIYLFTYNLSNERLKEIGLPALYFTIGFSLIWLAYEKLYYPSWGLYLLEQNPQLALGLPKEFFLQAAAFVEISLGYLLIIGLLERPLAAVITVVFFLTTLVFGKLEVIGHTPLHAALIVFLFNGTGRIYKPPIAIHDSIFMRIGFAAVNFIIVITVFLFAYSFSSSKQYETALAEAQTEEGNVHGAKMLDISDEETVPEFTNIEVVKENDESYNLHVEIENWKFTPELIGQTTRLNEGHAHVYVNGIKTGRMYSNWFHLGDLHPSEHQIAVVLNGNDHTAFVVEGEVIGAETTFIVE